MQEQELTQKDIADLIKIFKEIYSGLVSHLRNYLTLLTLMLGIWATFYQAEGSNIPVLLGLILLISLVLNLVSEAQITSLLNHLVLFKASVDIGIEYKFDIKKICLIRLCLMAIFEVGMIVTFYLGLFEFVIWFLLNEWNIIFIWHTRVEGYLIILWLIYLEYKAPLLISDKIFIKIREYIKKHNNKNI